MANLPEHLPDGFQFVGSEDIKPTEIVDLRSAGDWGTERNLELWQQILDQSVATVGVRDDGQTLVGVGFLAGNARHAVLCDFIVHPDQRGQGIGTAILNRRINIADGLSIPYLYTELAPTNRLRPHYETLGFLASGHLYSRAARRHPDEM